VLENVLKFCGKWAKIFKKNFFVEIAGVAERFSSADYNVILVKITIKNSPYSNL
jgi:hypothetical protein